MFCESKLCLVEVRQNYLHRDFGSIPSSSSGRVAAHGRVVVAESLKTDADDSKQTRGLSNRNNCSHRSVHEL